MRTGMFLLAGLLLMVVALTLGKLFSEQYPTAKIWGIGVAIVVWLVLTALNFWTGVARAGYSVREELPIFLLLFAVPVIAGLVLRRLVGA